jgi:hypothetical protein
VFLNGEAEPRPGWLANMLRLAEADPSLGVIGSRLLSADGAIHAGVSLRDLGVPYLAPPGASADGAEPFPGVADGALLISADLFQRLGGFADGPLAQLDLCLRVWASGARVVSCPGSTLAVAQARQPTLDKRFLRRWAGRWPQAMRPLVGQVTLPDALRRFVTVAFADELIASPELIRAYLAEFGEADDATLLVYAPDEQPARLADRLGGLLAQVGQVEADLLALAVKGSPRGEAALLHAADAVLSRRQSANGTPVFDEAGLPALRAAADRLLGGQPEVLEGGARGVDHPRAGAPGA